MSEPMKRSLSVPARSAFTAWEVETGWWFGIGDGAHVFVTHEEADKFARAILFEDEEAEDA